MKQIAALVKGVGQKQSSVCTKPPLRKPMTKKKKKRVQDPKPRQDQLSGCIDSSVNQSEQCKSREPASNFTLSTLFHTTMNFDIEDDLERSIRVPRAVLPKSNRLPSAPENFSSLEDLVMG